jgi:hypothetical protein
MFFISSCKEEHKKELPFKEEKIINILADMHFAKSAAEIQSAEVRDSMKLVYEDQVYSINGITEQEYIELKQFLESDLDLYYDIEKKVHQYLKTIQNDKD